MLPTPRHWGLPAWSSNTHLQGLANQLHIQHLKHKLQAYLGTEMILSCAEVSLFSDPNSTPEAVSRLGAVSHLGC